jgi:hypothetical protein
LLLWQRVAMRILEQGASNLQGGGEGSPEAVSTLMLVMSTLLSRRQRTRGARPNAATWTFAV